MTQSPRNRVNDVDSIAHSRRQGVKYTTSKTSSRKHRINHTEGSHSGRKLLPYIGLSINLTKSKLVYLSKTHTLNLRRIHLILEVADWSNITNAIRSYPKALMEVILRWRQRSFYMHVFNFVFIYFFPGLLIAN